MTAALLLAGIRAEMERVPAPARETLYTASLACQLALFHTASLALQSVIVADHDQEFDLGPASRARVWGLFRLACALARA